MYEINFHTKFSSTWFASLSIAASSFTFLVSLIVQNYIRKVLDGKVRNFSPTKISSFTVAHNKAVESTHQYTNKQEKKTKRKPDKQGSTSTDKV